MLKKSYLVIGSIIFCLFFSFNVKAATNIVTANIPVTDGVNLRIETQSYTSLLPDTTTIDDSGTPQILINRFNPVFDLCLRWTAQDYLNGYCVFDITYTVSGNTTTGTFAGIEFLHNSSEEGIIVSVNITGNNSVRVSILFDNYHNTSNTTELGQLIFHYNSTWDSSSVTPGSISVTSTISNITSAVEKTTGAINNRLSAIIYNSIYQATGSQLQTMINLLSSIYNQDYTYYVNLTSQIAQLHSDNQQTHTDLINILNELDLDFQQVQTVLDLFPSYRTQVLQYWQDLLAMNAAQSSAAAEVESEYADKEAQSATLAAGLGQLVLPSVNSNDFNVLNQVDGTQKANFFGLLSIITNNGFITTLLIIVVTGAIVGYILYGKK